MRLFTSIFCTLFLALSAFGQAIDYRALRTNQFSTNVPSRGYVGIIGYGVTNIPGTNVQLNAGTGITFTTNGASITITATGTNQVSITNAVVRAGTNVVVETNAPTDWTINAATDTNMVRILSTNVSLQNQYWTTNAAIANSISNRYGGTGLTVWVNGGVSVGNGVLFSDNALEINGGQLASALWTPNTVLSSDGNQHANSIANGTGALTNNSSGAFGWAPFIQAIAAGTNITTVTNGRLITVSVANTNLPVVVAGTNVTVVTNGLAYTVSGQPGGGGSGAVGPGTINQVAKFVATTNVGDSIYKEVATNMWVAQSLWNGTAYTNHITNTMVGEWTSPTNWVALSLVSAGPASEFAELHAVQGSSHTTGMWPLHIMDTWSFEPLSPVAGHTAGELFPVQDDANIIGDNSHRIKNVTVGTGGIDIGVAATQPALRFHNLFTSTWFGIDGVGSSLAFYRDTGITAAFDKPNGNLCFDVAGNYIGFGTGISNCTAFFSTGEAVTNGLIQIGTNSAVASPVPAGIMSSRGSGTDKGGADLVVAGGVSTGTGTSGKILFATSGSAAGSSSTLNGLTNRMEIDPGTGNVTIYSNLTVNGSISGGAGSFPAALTNNDTRNITFKGPFTVQDNGVPTVIASNTITSGSITLSGSNTLTGTLDLETAAELRTTNNVGTTGQVLTSAGSGKSPYWATATASGGGGTNSGPIALAYDGTIITNVLINAATPVGCVTNAILPYRMTMTTNALFKNPTGMLDGQRITIEFIQDATGSRLAYFDTKYAFGTDITGITLSTTASATDFATFIYHQNADKWRCVGFVRGY